jgi:hypothetical protein
VTVGNDIISEQEWIFGYVRSRRDRSRDELVPSGRNVAALGQGNHAPGRSIVLNQAAANFALAGHNRLDRVPRPPPGFPRHQGHPDDSFLKAVKSRCDRPVPLLKPSLEFCVPIARKDATTLASRRNREMQILKSRPSSSANLGSDYEGPLCFFPTRFRMR